MIGFTFFWVLIILGSAVTIPLIVIYKLSNLWMAYVFPAMVKLLIS